MRRLHGALRFAKRCGSGFPRNALLMVLVLGLPSCGFAPVYGNNASTEGVLRHVAMEDPSSQVEYVFLKAVEERIPPPQNPRYRIEYQVVLSHQGLDVIGVSRVQVIGNVVARFIDLDTNAVKFVTVVDAFTGYTTGGGGFQDVRRRDAEARLMQILADNFITRLMVQSMTLDPEDT